VCHGFDALPRGRAIRCSGFTSGRWCHCTREEFAGSLPLDEKTDPASYLHVLDGPCRCGAEHSSTVESAVAVQARTASWADCVSHYIYRDRAGAESFAIGRTTDKDFVAFHPTNAGWRPGLNGAPRILYRLDELTRKPHVALFLCEGEKDADALAGVGLLATTNPFGAGKWRDEYAAEFVGRPRVVVMVDNDDKGRSHADDVGRSAVQVGATVVRLELTDLPPKGDVSDWLAQGHTADELKEMVACARHWAPPVVAASPAPVITSRPVSDGFVLTRIGHLLAEPDEATDWLVQDLLPNGGLGFIGAKPKAGKSTFCRNLVVAVVRGDDFLGRRCTQGKAIYLALEEKRSEVRRHFRQLGATGEDDLLVHIAKAPEKALPALLLLIQEHRPALVVIDPLLRFTRVRDEKAYAELSNALEGVMAAARESNAASWRPTTAPRRRAWTPSMRSWGSTALSGAPDTIVVIRRREQERTIESIQRYGPDMERQILEMDEPIGRITLAGTVRAAHLAGMEQRVLEVLRKAGEMSTDELRDAAAASKNDVVDALAALMAQGSVVRDGNGKKGDPYRYRAANPEGAINPDPPAKEIPYSVLIPTPRTEIRNPETTSNPLQDKDLFRISQVSRPGEAGDSSSWRIWSHGSSQAPRYAPVPA